MAFMGVNKQDLVRLLALQAAGETIFNTSDTYIIDGLWYNYNSGNNAMDQIEPAGPFPVLFNPQTNLFEASGYYPPQGDVTGWADYSDTEYTEGSPWEPTVDQWNNVPIDALSKIESQLPPDVSEFYNAASGKILGRNGDGLLITAEFIAKPTTATTTYMDVAFFIGNSLGPLADGRIYQRTLSFPKGQNVARVHSLTVGGFTLDTWETNGAIFQMNPTAAVDVYKARLVLTRTHKAKQSLS